MLSRKRSSDVDILIWVIFARLLRRLYVQFLAEHYYVRLVAWAFRLSRLRTIDDRDDDRRTIDDRAFGAVAQRVWNDLPVDIVSAPSLALFKRRLKTHLFGQSFG